MLIDLIAQPRVADVIEAHELIERVAATIRHDEAAERHGQPRLSAASAPVSWSPGLARQPE